MRSFLLKTADAVKNDTSRFFPLSALPAAEKTPPDYHRLARRLTVELAEMLYFCKRIAYLL